METPETHHDHHADAAVRHSLMVYRRIALVFLALTGLVAALVLYVVFARAKVIVLSRQEHVESEFIVDIAREPGPGEVRGMALDETASLERVFSATRAANVEGHARGTVRMTSRLSRAQPLVAGTRLETPDGALYRIASAVTVPAFGAVEVDAVADEPGGAFDADALTFVIPGLNPTTREFFTVETTTPLAGGMRTITAVTQDDIDAATATLLAELTTLLTERLEARADAQGFPLLRSAQMVSVELADAKPSVPAGTEAPEFTLVVEARAVGIYLDDESFHERLDRRLRDLIGFDQTLLSLTEDATARRVEKRDPATGRTNLRVKVRGTAIMSPAAPALDPEKLAGISVEAAIAYLQGIDGVSSASVSTSPFWSVRMPATADRIMVEVR